MVSRGKGYKWLQSYTNVYIVALGLPWTLKVSTFEMTEVGM